MIKNGNQVHAIKCIKKSSLNKASTENLLREIKILKQIKHDYIVDLIDFQVIQF
jgi:serine/threonine protein kinase